MEELIKQLKEKVGIDQANAEKISAALKQNVAKAPELVSGDSQGLVTLLQKAGVDESVVQKIVAFVKQNAANLQTWLGAEGGGILKKAKEMIGGMTGRQDAK